MRVISGTLKGRNIIGYNINGTRPTMDRVKESIFGTIQNYIKDSIVLDLFAGSGNLGIEAISNGAKHCYFVDNNIEAIKVIKKNIAEFNIKDKSSILHKDYNKALNFFCNNKIKFDIIFVDPPYKYEIIDKIINKLIEYDLVNLEGIIVLEFSKDILKESYDNLKLIKNKKYGEKNVYIYKK